MAEGLHKGPRAALAMACESNVGNTGRGAGSGEVDQLKSSLAALEHAPKPSRSGTGPRRRDLPGTQPRQPRMA
ncbi:hypothetical protein GE21DRAFT_1278773 [Neurospora crassa]|nr:hypothetical protein GE21DRAFT_1278773 [Neurospora crassa]